MSLFQESIIRKHLAYLDQEIVDQAYVRFKNVYSANKITNIKVAKEEQYQEGFIKDIFGEVLGYSVFPEQPFNIQTEKKNEADSKKADGAIFQGENVVGVIELKDNKTKNLDAVKNQAFGYKNNHKDCSYVISSNFHKLRFYVDDATEYEEFDLYNLDKETFKRFYLYLRKEGLLDKNIPKLLRQETKFHEENITKSLYKDYSSFKNSFFQNVVDNNPQYDKLLLFKKSQKFLDKVLFVLFAEDKGLVSTNSIVQIVEKWNDLKNDAFDTPKPLYQLVSLFFNNLFKGKYDQKGFVLIPEFGGEIFAPDEVLDNLIVDDAVLQDDLLKLSRYDFNTDVDVNILGHIFEHSLSEIEEVEAELKGEVADKTKGKRKKDGVFYTPKYITKYIVENTVGKLCAEKKSEMKLDIDISIFDHQKADGKLNAKGIELYETLNQYKDWLLTLKILDPACGSGAFLNEAVNFLVQEHQFVDDIIADLTNTPMRLFDTDLAILENNIYGVDINDESIEIAKLSLWLRTAKQGRKLSNLSNNIKCGNSLIDDPAVAGDKAFNWQEEFPEVFANGGFDVVIGNPPYVRVQNLSHNEIDYFKTHKITAFKRVDISTLFFELSSTILKEFGILGFITSNQFQSTEYGYEIRKFIKTQFRILDILDFGDLPVFEGALTYVSIYCFEKNFPQDFKYKKILSLNENINIGKYLNIELKRLEEDKWIFTKESEAHLLKKLSTDCCLGKYGNAWAGLFTGKDDLLMFDFESMVSSGIEKELFLPVLRAEDMNRNGYVKASKYVIYPYKEENEKTIVLSEQDLERLYPIGYKYLLENKDKLQSRKDSRKTFHDRKDWYALTRFGTRRVFKQQKLVSPGEVKEHKFSIDISGSGFSCARVFAITVNDKIDIKTLMIILNSKLSKFYLQRNSSLKAGGYYSYSSNVLNSFPIYEKVPKALIEIAESIILSQNDYNELIQKFQRSLERKFSISELPKKLQDWYLLSYAEFIKELAKKKIKLSLSEEAEWESYFSSEAKKALDLKAQIEKTDKEIDQMVYALYDLTEDEIKIVEGH